MNQRKVIELKRVSTDKQETDRQDADLERNRHTFGLTAVRTVPLSVSGRKVRKNQEIKRILADLKRPDIAGVSVSALDRLFRLDRYEDFGILDDFRDTGKLIFSAKEGLLDPASDAGFIMSLMSGAQAGLEWRELRRRTTQGKELLRTRGGNPNGPGVLPRGVSCEPIKDRRGRTIGGKWFYTEPDVSRVRQAYDLLFERRSWPDIAERIGGGFTDTGVKSSLKNPLWKGIRRYTEGRDEPLDVKVIDEPLISPERWAAAQAIILEKRTRWSKTRRPPHILLSGGLLRCACGKPCYVRTTNRAFYYCSTGFPGRGPKCRARSIQQQAADQEVTEYVSTRLVDTAYLRSILAAFKSAAPTRDRDREKLARQREKLEAERQRLLRMTLKGACSEEDFARESKRLEAEMRDLDRLAPAPLPAALDPAKLVVRLTRTFARFGKQPFAERRDLLRSTIREFILEDGAITAFTLNGGFVNSANSPSRSRWQPSLRCPGRAPALPPPRIPGCGKAHAPRSEDSAWDLDASKPAGVSPLFQFADVNVGYQIVALEHNLVPLRRPGWISYERRLGIEVRQLLDAPRGSMDPEDVRYAVLDPRETNALAIRRPIVGKGLDHIAGQAPNFSATHRQDHHSYLSSHSLLSDEPPAIWRDHRIANVPLPRSDCSNHVSRQILHHNLRANGRPDVSCDHFAVTRNVQSIGRCQIDLQIEWPTRSPQSIHPESRCAATAHFICDSKLRSEPAWPAGILPGRRQLLRRRPVRIRHIDHPIAAEACGPVRDFRSVRGKSHVRMTQASILHHRLGGTGGQAGGVQGHGPHTVCANLLRYGYMRAVRGKRKIARRGPAGRNQNLRPRRAVASEPRLPDPVGPSDEI
jgi:DNA invertase Pin-like site-specific DNA recombinase